MGPLVTEGQEYKHCPWNRTWMRWCSLNFFTVFRFKNSWLVNKKQIVDEFSIRIISFTMSHFFDKPTCVRSWTQKTESGANKKEERSKVTLTGKKKKTPQIGFKIKTIHWQGVQWVFSDADPTQWYNQKWKWKLLSRVRLFATPRSCMEFSRPEYWSE